MQTQIKERDKITSLIDRLWKIRGQRDKLWIKLSQQNRRTIETVHRRLISGKSIMVDKLMKKELIWDIIYFLSN